MAMPQCCYLTKGPSHTTNMLTSSKNQGLYILAVTAPNEESPSRLYRLALYFEYSIEQFPIIQLLQLVRSSCPRPEAQLISSSLTRLCLFSIFQIRLNYIYSSPVFWVVTSSFSIILDIYVTYRASASQICMDLPSCLLFLLWQDERV